MDALLAASRETGLGANTVKTKYVFIGHADIITNNCN